MPQNAPKTPKARTLVRSGPSGHDVYLPLQQSDVQPPPQQSGQQVVQSLHLSEQHAVQHSLFAVSCEVWPNAVTASTTAMDKTENMRFI
jgi:hypothetical protein